MITIGDIYDFIDSFAPFSSAMDFDNSGLLVGSREQKVEKAIVSLDITDGVVNEAVNEGAQLIISHHPVIFDPLKSLSPSSPVYLLAKNEVGALCAHTNLDLSDKGVNVCLGKKLGLNNIRKHSEGECLFFGELTASMKPSELAEKIKTDLCASSVSYTVGKEDITLVGFCSGSGAEYMDDAFSMGAQAFLTGEAKYHNYIYADALGKTLITAGHFFTEDIVTDPLISMLQAEFPEISFVKSKTFTDPAHVL